MGKTKTSCNACGRDTRNTLCSICREQFKKWIGEYNCRSTPSVDSNSSSEADANTDYTALECLSITTSSSTPLTILRDSELVRDIYMTVEEWLEYSDDLIYM